MNGHYTVLAYAPSGDLVRFALTFRLAGIRETASAIRRVPERLRKVTRLMDEPRHVTPLTPAAASAASGRHRWHLRAVGAGLAAGLALVLAALLMRNEPLFWAGYGLAAAAWLGGHQWCRRRNCLAPKREG